MSSGADARGRVRSGQRERCWRRAKSSWGERAPQCFPHGSLREGGAAPRGRVSGRERGVNVLRFNGRPSYPSGSPDPARGCGIARLTRIPLPSHAAAAACLSTSGPPAIRHPRAARCPSLRTRQGPLPVPHDTSRHDLVPATPVEPGRRGVPPAPWRPPWPSVVRFPPARYHEVGVPVPLRCVDRLRCCFAARHWRSFNLPLSHAGLFVPATSPVATTVCGAP